MATNSDIVSDLLQDSLALVEKDNETSGDPSCCSHQYEILEPEVTESDLGQDKPVRKRESGTSEIVKEWDLQVMENSDVEKEVLQLSDHSMHIIGTKELPGRFKKAAACLGMWKSIMPKRKGTVEVSLALTFTLSH